MAEHHLRVGPLPAWLQLDRLLGPTRVGGPDGDGWQVEAGAEGAVEAQARLPTALAADLVARLRGLGFDGRALVCEVEPPLRRSVTRRARSEDARRRRVTTPGFSRAGVRLDDVGRISLTPEVLAQRVAAGAQGRPVVDAGCGAGGNAIAFARAGSRVCAIESDAARLELARHNAEVYGVGDRIEFVHGDALEQVPARRDESAILFIDPPWGADWNRRGCGLAELPLLAALAPLALGYAALWAKVPASFATRELLGDPPGGDAQALFGEAQGDRRRVKFVLVRR
ncbi:methyltransferase domain-containing protein [Enhygromyxa salina]|uniref:methyltransferase domain-containing protein n=1 Tax=Enhygromyxa salina TaxID=215803 RepID=UPI0015E5EA57|nr:methyltransferase domain-containing protein [Enhygromyxa salina]